MDSRDFAKDSVFCRYAYVLDMDNEILEIYEGFQKEYNRNTEERFHSSESDKNGYFPIKLIEKIKFEDLTLNTMDELEKKHYEGQ